MTAGGADYEMFREGDGLGEQPTTHCPKCDSVEWFPGAACWDCGWEGSAADAYEHLRQRVIDLKAMQKRVLSVGHNDNCIFCAHKDRAAGLMGEGGDDGE